MEEQDHLPQSANPCNRQRPCTARCSKARVGVEIVEEDVHNPKCSWFWCILNVDQILCILCPVFTCAFFFCVSFPGMSFLVLLVACLSPSRFFFSVNVLCFLLFLCPSSSAFRDDFDLISHAASEMPHALAPWTDKKETILQSAKSRKMCCMNHGVYAIC